MHISEATKFKIETQYKLEDIHLTFSNQCKYLGVTLQSDLKWNYYAEEKVSKANQILAMTQRNVCVTSAATRKLAYNTLACPYLEYASVVRSPWQTYLKDAIEKVQRRVAHYAYNKHGMVSVTSLINDFKWDINYVKSNLVYVCMYKIHHGLIKFPLSINIEINMPPLQ